MVVDNNWNGMSIAKISERLFDPTFSEKSSNCLLDQHSDRVIVYNPSVYFVDKPSQGIKTTCNTAMGMFIPYEKSARIEPVSKKTALGNILNVKAFWFSLSNKRYGSFGSMEVAFDMIPMERGHTDIVSRMEFTDSGNKVVAMSIWSLRNVWNCQWVI